MSILQDSVPSIHKDESEMSYAELVYDLDKAFANAQDQYDYQDDDSEFIMSVW